MCTTNTQYEETCLLERKETRAFANKFYMKASENINILKRKDRKKKTNKEVKSEEERREKKQR